VEPFKPEQAMSAMREWQVAEGWWKAPVEPFKPEQAMSAMRDWQVAEGW